MDAAVVREQAVELQRQVPRQFPASRLEQVPVVRPQRQRDRVVVGLPPVVVVAPEAEVRPRWM